MMIDSNENHLANIVTHAREWIGTPYMHQASVKGIGADCLGLVRGVWREVIGDEPQSMPGYTMDWGEVSNRETMLEAAQKWFLHIRLEEARAGDLVLFRWHNATIIKHAGILSNAQKFIHAYEKAGVVETTMGSQWRKRVAAAFRFPDKTLTG